MSPRVYGDTFQYINTGSVTNPTVTPDVEEQEMPTKTWKKNELSWRSIGAHRNHFEAEDCSHSLFSIECKHRSPKNYPKRVRDWYQQSLQNAGEGKIAILAIHMAGEIRGNDLVIMRRSDFEDLYGRLKPSVTPQDLAVEQAKYENRTEDTGSPEKIAPEPNKEDL